MTKTITGTGPASDLRQGIQHRLARVKGQMEALARKVEKGNDSGKLLLLASAVEGSIDGVITDLLQGYLEDTVGGVLTDKEKIKTFRQAIRLALRRL